MHWRTTIAVHAASIVFMKADCGKWQSALPCTLSAFNIYCTSNWAHSDMPIGTSTYIVDCFVEALQTVLVGAIVSETSLVFLPTWGTIDGDLWVREIAYKCRLVYKGARDIGDSIAPYYWVLVLPDRFIDALIQGDALDVSMFPHAASAQPLPHPADCIEQVFALVQTRSDGGTRDIECIVLEARDNTRHWQHEVP